MNSQKEESLPLANEDSRVDSEKLNEDVLVSINCRKELELHSLQNPELKGKWDRLILDSCTSSTFEKKSFYGRTKTRQNGYFYTDSLVLDSVQTNVYYVTDTSFTLDWNKKIFVYQFTSKSDEQLFEGFIESMDRALWGTKEIHEFIKSGDKWILYFEGNI